MHSCICENALEFSFIVSPRRLIARSLVDSTGLNLAVKRKSLLAFHKFVDEIPVHLQKMSTKGLASKGFCCIIGREVRVRRCCRACRCIGAVRTR